MSTYDLTHTPVKSDNPNFGAAIEGGSCAWKDPITLQVCGFPIQLHGVKIKTPADRETSG